MSKRSDSTQLELESSKGKLWNLLLSNKQFYAFEFSRDQIIDGIQLDFLCSEAKFGICVEPSGFNTAQRLLTSVVRTRLEAAGYQIIILSSEEITDAFSSTVSFLDEQFTTLTRFQCGYNNKLGW